MKVKSFLLGSAAAFAVAGGAHAADLSVAEPVDFVKVCDYFGTGYFYIPGTDTCLKMGGYVQFDVNVHNSSVIYRGDTSFSADGLALGKDHSSKFDMGTEVSLTFTAKTMTEMGELVGFADVRGKYDNGQTGPYVGVGTTSGVPSSISIANGSSDGNVYLDSAYLSFGPLLAGHLSSTFDYGGGFDTGAGASGTFGGRSDTKTDQIRLSWAAAGFGLALGIEDPRDRWGTGLPGQQQGLGIFGTPNDGDVTMPDVIAAISITQATWDAKLSAGVSQTAPNTKLGPDPILTGYGFQGGITFKLDTLAVGDQFRLQGAWANNAASFVGGKAPTGASWSALASFKHLWTPTLSSNITAAYISDPGKDSPPFGFQAVRSGFGKDWYAGADLVWAPVKGFTATVATTYLNDDGKGSWRGKLRLVRSW